MKRSQQASQEAPTQSRGIVLSSDLRDFKESERGRIVPTSDLKPMPPQKKMPSYVKVEFIDPNTRLIMAEPVVDSKTGKFVEKEQLGEEGKNYAVVAFMKKQIDEFLQENPNLLTMGLVYLPKRMQKQLNQQLKLAVEKKDINQFDEIVKKYRGHLQEKSCLLAHQKTLLHLACENGSLAIVKKLIQLQFSFNTADEDGNTPLHICAQKGYQEIIEIAEGLPTNFEARNTAGYTPTHLALKSQKIATFKHLLQRGANCTTVTTTGQTMMHTVIEVYSEKDSKELLILLIQRGLAGTVENKQKQTPSQYAVAVGKTSLANWLNTQIQQHQTQRILKIRELEKTISSQQRQLRLLSKPIVSHIDLSSEGIVSLDMISERLKKNCRATQLTCLTSATPFDIKFDDSRRLATSLFQHPASSSHTYSLGSVSQREVRREISSKEVSVANNMLGYFIQEYTSGYCSSSSDRSYFENEKVIGKLLAYDLNRHKPHPIIIIYEQNRQIQLKNRYQYGSNAGISLKAELEITVLDMCLTDSFFAISLYTKKNHFWAAGDFTQQAKNNAHLILSGDEHITKLAIINSYLILHQHDTNCLRPYDLNTGKKLDDIVFKDSVGANNFTLIKLINCDQEFLCGIVKYDLNGNTCYAVYCFDGENLNLFKKFDFNSPIDVGFYGDYLFIISNKFIQQYELSTLEKIKEISISSDIKFDYNQNSAFFLWDDNLYYKPYSARDFSSYNKLTCYSFSLTGHNNMVIEKKDPSTLNLGERIFRIVTENNNLLFYCHTLKPITISLDFRQIFQNELQVIAIEYKIILSLPPLSWSETKKIFNQFKNTLQCLLDKQLPIRLIKSQGRLTIACNEPHVYQQVATFIRALQQDSYTRLKLEADSTAERLGTQPQTTRFTNKLLPQLSIYNEIARDSTMSSQSHDEQEVESKKQVR